MQRKDLTGIDMVVEGTRARCILQTPTYRLWAQMERSPLLKWDDAKEYCSKQFNGKGYCPNRAEMLWCWANFKHDQSKLWFWTSEVFNSSTTWFLLWGNGDVVDDRRVNYGYVRAFYKQYYKKL